MPRLFNYSSYPHIFDAFVANANFEAQLALRLTRRDVRDAVDRLHLYHLVLTPLGEDSVSVTGVNHRIAALRSLEPGAPRPYPAARLTRHTRVVDVRGFFPASCNLTLLREAFPNLDILRMCSSRDPPPSYTPYVPFEAKSLVLFTTPLGGNCNPGPFDPWTSEYQFGPAVLPMGEPRELSKKFNKIVVNMKGMDIPIADMFRYARCPPKHVTEIDIIVPYYRSETSPGSIAHFEEVLLGWDTAELINCPHVKYTLIGLDVVRPGYDVRFVEVLREHFSQHRYENVDYSNEGVSQHTSPPPSLTATERSASAVTGDMKSKVQPDIIDKGKDREEKKGEKRKTHAEMVDSYLSAIRTMTMEEYQQRLGLVQAALHTVEYLDNAVAHGGFDMQAVLQV